MPPNESTFQETRARIAQLIQELPSLPIVVTKVLEETQKENVSATTIERLIGSDAALTAKTLRVVNSAYYGMSKQIESLSQAVVILGIQQLRNLVLSIGAMGAFRATTSAQKEAHRQHWMHSIASASAAITLARKRRVGTHDQEVAFVAGLLHDLGRLFLFTNFAETYIDIDRRAKNGEDLLDLERRHLGLTHSQVGQVLAHVWKFPDRLGELMGAHEGPFTDDSNTMGLIVHVAHLLADQVTWDPDALDRIDPVAKKWLDQFEEEVFQIRNEVEAKIYAYEMLYGMLAA